MSTISSVGGAAAFAVQAARNQPPQGSAPPVDSDGDHDNTAPSRAAPSTSTSKVNVLA